MNPFAAESAHYHMLHQQIRTWEPVAPNVIDVLDAVPRDSFVPNAYRGVAFADVDIPLGNGYNMLHPRIVARLLHAMAIRPGDNILEIGSGSGYVTACLSKLGGYVTSIERDEDLVDTTATRLALLGFRNLTVSHGDATVAIPSGSFDVIVVTASLPVRDARLERALTIGGRMFVVLGEQEPMVACRITRSGEGSWQQERLFETELAPLANTIPPSRFQF